MEGRKTEPAKTSRIRRVRDLNNDTETRRGSGKIKKKE